MAGQRSSELAAIDTAERDSGGAGRDGGSSRSSQSQPGHLALIDSRLGTGRSARVQDQLASITIFRSRRRLRRQPTGWHTFNKADIARR